MWKYSVCFLMPALTATAFDLDGLGSDMARIGLALALATLVASVLSTALFRGAGIPFPGNFPDSTGRTGGKRHVA